MDIFAKPLGPEFSFFYQYVVGGIAILLTLIIGFKSKEINIKTPKGKHLLKLILGGYAIYFTLHGVFTFIIPHM